MENIEEILSKWALEIILRHIEEIRREAGIVDIDKSFGVKFEKYEFINLKKEGENYE